MREEAVSDYVDGWLRMCKSPNGKEITRLGKLFARLSDKEQSEACQRIQAVSSEAEQGSYKAQVEISKFSPPTT